MNFNKENADLATNKIDWLLEKKGSQLVLAFLLVIILILSAIVIKSEYNDKKRYDLLEKKVNNCSDTYNENVELKMSINKIKSDFILLNAIYDFDPVAKWVTGRDGKVLKVNKAYVKKYLQKLGFTASDLLLTNGSHIFGEKAAMEFVANNERVIRENRPITFQEIEVTTKFPITIGNYIFAVGGTEYEKFK